MPEWPSYSAVHTDYSKMIEHVRKHVGPIPRADAEKLLRDADDHIRRLYKDLSISDNLGAADDLRIKAMVELERYLSYLEIIDGLASNNGLERLDADDGLESKPLFSAQVPLHAEFLFSLFLSKADRQTIPGDLEEEFLTSILPKFGPRRAKFWYWSQALTAIARCNPLVKWAFVGGGIFKVFAWITRRISG